MCASTSLFTRELLTRGLSIGNCVRRPRSQCSLTRCRISDDTIVESGVPLPMRLGTHTRVHQHDHSMAMKEDVVRRAKSRSILASGQWRWHSHVCGDALLRLQSSLRVAAHTLDLPVSVSSSARGTGTVIWRHNSPGPALLNYECTGLSRYRGAAPSGHHDLPPRLSPNRQTHRCSP